MSIEKLMIKGTYNKKMQIVFCNFFTNQKNKLKLFVKINTILRVL